MALFRAVALALLVVQYFTDVSCHHHAGGEDDDHEGQFDEGSLRHSLLASYNSRVPPGYPVILQYGVSPIKIVDVDSKKGLLTVDIWLKNIWQDSRLSWDKDLYFGLESTFFTKDDIYVPEMTLYNGVLTYLNPDTEIVGLFSGTMIYYPAVRAEVYCDLPADHFHNKICSLTIGPWSHDSSQISLSISDPVADSSFQYQTGDYVIGRSTASLSVSTYECCPGYEYATLELSLNVSSRDSESHDQPAAAEALKMDDGNVEYDTKHPFPLIFAPYFVLLLFLLPPKTTDRVFLGVIVSVSLILIWTSSDMTTQYEQFLKLSVVVTIAATFASLLPCKMRGPMATTDPRDSKISSCKSRIGILLDLMMFAAVAVVLCISTIGTFSS